MSLVCLFRSTDNDAPTLTGQVGSMYAVLKACLADGYGSVAISAMTRSGSTVTVECGSAHGFEMVGNEGGVGGVGPVVLISGADQADYNGRWRVTGTPAADEFTFDIGVLTPVTPATGTMTAKRAGAGWTEHFAGGNKGAFKMGAGFNDHYVRIDDNGPTGGTARCCSMRGYETMSDVDTGTGLFPTTVQETNGLAIPKSNTADATARAWRVLADEAAFYVWVNGNSASPAFGYISTFGKLAASFKAGDAYDTLINGGAVSTATSLTTSNGPGDSNFVELIANYTSASSGLTARHYIARSFSQLGTSAPGGKFAPFHFSTSLGSGSPGNNTLTYPAGINNGLFSSDVYWVDTNNPRARLPGMLAPIHNVPLTDGDCVKNIPTLPGRYLMAWSIAEASATANQALLDISGPWR